MPRLFVANVTFEHELVPHRQTLPQRLLRLGAELAGLWPAVADDGDWIWCPEPVDADFWPRMETHGCPHVHACGTGTPPPAGLDLVPWGWSDAVRRLARSLHACAAAPPQAVVKLTNSRHFAFTMETDWHCGLDRNTLIATIPDLEAVLSKVPPGSRWVLKCEHGAAARDRVLGHGPLPPPQTIAWVRARLAHAGRLFFEPWVDRIAEAGLQWDVPESGPPQLIGVTPLLCDDAGHYLGSRFGADFESQSGWADAIELSRRAAERLQEAGYFGPLGIDAMRYRDGDGNERLRPLQDINARWTMGRIALGWRRLTTSGIWRHGSALELAAAAVVQDVIETSPRQVGGRPVDHCTWIEPPSGL